MITVAAFAVLFVMVQGMPKPQPGISADLQATLERTTPTNVTLVIRHLGGADLANGSTWIAVAVNNTTSVYTVAQGLGGAAAFSFGTVWRLLLPTSVSPDARVYVTVVTLVTNSVLYSAELQAGTAAGVGSYPPLITIAWAVSASNAPSVANNGIQTWRIHAVVIDPDNNLNFASGVWADVNVSGGAPPFTATSLSSGHLNLSRVEGSHYQTADLVMAAVVAPGNYTIAVHAQDASNYSASIGVPFSVTATSSGSAPQLAVSGYSIAPISVGKNATNVGLIRLNLTVSGGDTSVGQLAVTKRGVVGDSQLTLQVWQDADGNGVFDPANDSIRTPPTGFTSGIANIYSVPIVTVPSGALIVVFIVGSLVNASDGSNVTLSLDDTDSVRGTGIATGASAATSGAFPISTADIVVGSKLNLIPKSGAPDRLLINTNNVRLLEFDLKAAGEGFSVKSVNVTLTGNIPRSNAQATLKINNVSVGGQQSFDPSRLAKFNINVAVLETQGNVPMEVLLSITGKVGQTVGIQIAAESDTFAMGNLTGKGRNGKAPVPFPQDSGLVTLTSTGNLSIDDWNESSLATSVRAGKTDVYLHTFKVRAHGESMDFNKLVFVQTGNLTDGQFVAVTVRVRGGTILSATFFAGQVTWDAGVSGKLFAIPINATNRGEVVFDVYTNLTTGTQGKEFALSIADSSKVRGWGKISLTSQYANAESAPYPMSVGVRRIQGDVLLYGTNLAPASILAPANLVPVLKVTVRAVGENMSLDEIFLLSLQGPPPAGAITVHLYRDVNNDTTTTINGDDLDLSGSEAGPFGSDALKAFTPGENLTNSVDANFVFAVDVTTAGAGFSVETRVNGSNATVRGVYSGTIIPTNAQIGITNAPNLIYQTPPAPIYDRGAVTIAGWNINPASTHQVGTTQRFLKVELNASATEGVRLNSLKLHLNGNVSGTDVTAHIWWDKDKDGTVSAGDVELGNGNFASGDLTVSGSPLFTIAAGTGEHLVVTLQLNSGMPAGPTVGVEVSAASFVGTGGAISTLGITPTGSFPVAATTVPIL